jgi:CheY-like chemotaxis protein
MTDAREALEHVVGGARYDVILCDMNMPGMRGPEFLRELRRRAPDHARRVVFLTGSTTTTGHDVGDAEVRILHKPFDLDALRKLVREFA